MNSEVVAIRFRLDTEVNRFPRSWMRPTMLSCFGLSLISLRVLIFLTALLVLKPLSAIGEEPAKYVGAGSCASCHAEESKRWAGSHHDLAMQKADSSTVLGDFGNVSLNHFGVTSTFFRRDDRFLVRTEGARGTLEEFEVKYTFGVHPLQQYLIEFPGGRMQALGLAWDAREKEEGGQRWFHLYPDEKIAHDDELHWTQPSQNWNSMCAECHSTNLQKNYDPSTRSFSTTWSEIDVSCEACHGPGSKHLIWAEKKPGWEMLASNLGLDLLLDERKDVTWAVESNSGVLQRSQARSSEKEIEMCARCHSRRSPISQNYLHGDRLMDHYLPRRLDPGMYFVDGQMDDEVYVYGSFIQSKMYHSGVTCSDCHDPHSADLKLPGNAVCLQCHQADRYEAASHHFHQVGSIGASCAECHMPPRDYMVVDPRHDHSMRVPRPDLSVKLGTPNACNQCHKDQSSAWASTKIVEWYGRTPKGFQSYHTEFRDARNQEPAAGKGLAALIRNTQTPDIARATALTQIGPYLSRTTYDVLSLGLIDDNPLVRAAIPTTLEATPLNLRVRLAWKLLDDPVRAVRIEAAQVLAGTPAGDLPEQQRLLLENAISEYIESQMAMAERPEAQTNLGNLYAARGENEKARLAYQAAIDIDPRFVPAYVNLADFIRRGKDEKAAEEQLRDGIKLAADSADLHHALGLSLIRQKRVEEAIKELKKAARLDSQNPRYLYVYAIALNSTGKPRQAIMVLQGAHNRHPHSRDIVNALMTIHRDLGNTKQAQSYAHKLRQLSP